MRRWRGIIFVILGTRILPVSDSNTIGGTAAGEGNLVSGNTFDGISLQGSDSSTIEGNLIGTDNTGIATLANGGNGIYIFLNAISNQIGGVGGTGANTIAFNSGDGVLVLYVYQQAYSNSNAILSKLNGPFLYR